MTAESFAEAIVEVQVQRNKISDLKRSLAMEEEHLGQMETNLTLMANRHLGGKKPSAEAAIAKLLAEIKPDRDLGGVRQVTETMKWEQVVLTFANNLSSLAGNPVSHELREGFMKSCGYYD